MADDNLQTGSFTIDDVQSRKPTIMYGDGADALLDASSYYKYGLATDGSLDWSQELKNLRSFQYDKDRNFTVPPEDVRNEAVQNEKQRLKLQRNSNEFHREDLFAIGTVYLTIPPTQISITEEKHNFRYKSLRSATEIITSSGRSTNRVDLEIYFNGLDDINNKLRPLIAQFKCTPFLPIENSYVRTVIDPENRGILGTLERNKSDLIELEKRKEEVDKMKGIEEAKTGHIKDLVKEVLSMRNRNLITTVQSNRIVQMANNWYVGKDLSYVMRDQDARECIKPINDGTGNETLDFKEKFSEMTPIFKNAEIKFEDIGEYMQNYHNENDIPFNKGKKLIGSYFGKEILLYTPLLKWYLQQGLKITKFHCAIK